MISTPPPSLYFQLFYALLYGTVAVIALFIVGYGIRRYYRRRNHLTARRRI